MQVAFCNDCGLVQITETVPPQMMFNKDYPYYSSVSDQLLEHTRNNVERILERYPLGEDGLVVELASNDGYLLKNYMRHNIPVLGIDPASGPAQVAEQKGVSTINEFFTLDLAKNLKAQGITADVIHANNVLAHVPDLNGFVEGIRVLLKEHGVAVLEFPYVKDLIDHCEFDTIYHQHLCYFSVTALSRLFSKCGLFINHVERISTHGGSLRLYVAKAEKTDDSVKNLLNLEKREGVDQISYYRNFASQVKELKTSLLRLLLTLKQKGHSIAGYGAAAKGCTLMNYVGIGREIMDYIVDLNPRKHGQYMTGNRVPIGPAEWLLERMPDYVLILSWNFAEEIMEQQSKYTKSGGRFIVPIPDLRVIDACH